MPSALYAIFCAMRLGMHTRPMYVVSRILTLTCVLPMCTCIQVDSEQELSSLASTLEKEGKDFKLWVEQPENYPTCLATKPYPKTDIQLYFKKYKLLS